MPTLKSTTRIERKKKFSLPGYVAEWKKANKGMHAYHSPILIHPEAIKGIFAHAIGLPNRLPQRALSAKYPGYSYIGCTVTGAIIKHWYGISKEKIKRLQKQQPGVARKFK